MSDQAESRNCPYCDGWDVDRMFLGSLGVDSCRCRTCGARWDQDAHSGEPLSRSAKDSVLTPRR